MFRRALVLLLVESLLAAELMPRYNVPVPRSRRVASTCQGATNNPVYRFNCVRPGTKWEFRQRSFVDGTYAIETVCGCDVAPTRPPYDPEYVAPVEKLRVTNSGNCVLKKFDNEFIGDCSLANWPRAQQVGMTPSPET